MRWDDEGILLSARPLGEQRFIATVFTQQHGRHRGVFRSSKASHATLEAGTHVSCHWNARLEEQLGAWILEPIYSAIAYVLNQKDALRALNSAVELCMVCIPEREPAPAIFSALLILVQSFHDPALWPLRYINFEIVLLEHTGIRLDFSQCAATGTTKDLVYMSPRTGRAVSRLAGLPYHNKLLSLPAFLVPNMPEKNLISIHKQDILAGLALTGYFLSRVVLEPHGLEMPKARQRFLQRFQSNQNEY